MAMGQAPIIGSWDYIKLNCAEAGKRRARAGMVPSVNLRMEKTSCAKLHGIRSTRQRSVG
jgi:hypothetical protein